MKCPEDGPDWLRLHAAQQTRVWRPIVYLESISAAEADGNYFFIGLWLLITQTGGLLSVSTAKQQ